MSSGELAFNTMGAREKAEGVGDIGVGMLGYAFMGKAHSNALIKLRHMVWPPPLFPRLVAICGRGDEAVRVAAARYGYEQAFTDWHELVEHPEVELFDNTAPNFLHSEPTIAAARAGKHVACEKPLGRTAEESHEIWSAVAATGVVHLAAFNYRFFPAIRLAKEMLDAGEIGEVRHFRARYLQEFIVDDAFPKVWRLNKAEAGSGALGDLGSHIVDLGRYLVGEPVRVSGALTTFIKERPWGTVDVDDAFVATIEFENGAIGTLEGSRVALGRKNHMTWEINGTRGSVVFDQERMNELHVHLPGSLPGARAQGFRTVLVSERDHPYWNDWWPHGHMMGWEDTYLHELTHVIATIAGGGDIGPHGATFEDGYRCAEVLDAIARAAETGQRQGLSFRAAS